MKVNVSRHVPLSCRDVEDEPLFPSHSYSTSLGYVSPKYSFADLKLLKGLGITSLSGAEFCRIVSLDLERLDSKIKLASTSEDWQTRTAEKLLKIAKSDPSQVHALKCIPLQDGSWVSAGVGSVYFPEYNNVSVPNDLSLRLVRKESLSNPSRIKLFSAMGVQPRLPSMVTTKILNKYNSSTVELEASVAHLRWLYYFLPKEERSLDSRIRISASDGIPTYRFFVPFGKELRVADLYFETNDEFGVKKVCAERQLKGPDEGLSHYDVFFINSTYMTAVDPAVRIFAVSWLRWLEDFAGVRRVPRLVRSIDTSKLSDLFLWLVSERPEQVVGILQAHWSSYKDQLKPEIIKALRKVRALGRKVVIPLSRTWAPTEELVKTSQNVGLVEKMPFLKLPTELDVKTQE